MDWKALYTMQKDLDTYIEANHDLTGQDLFQQKHLALLVELGELANETRCFKFWSTKPPSEKAVILEEYIDGIHFMLSLGLEKGYYYESTVLKKDLTDVTEQFHHVFSSCILFRNEPTMRNYESMLENYLHLGNLLGFHESDIEEAYLTKNAVNYRRQNEGY